MDFLELAKSRYSVRKYKPDSVPEQDLLYVLEAGRVAPSAVNYQPWHFLVIREKENLEKIHSLYHREWFRQAPVVIIILANHHASWKRADGKDHADIDIAIAADHLTLAAADRSLGTCWICNFDKQKTVEVLKLPDHLEPVAFLPLGYPADSTDTNRHQQKRKPLDHIVSWEKPGINNGPS
ncbi:MAG: nitroreductase family protein [Bacteroidales bacterium]|nr:nitroreductase family protein [Bacteroidales bacterium]